MPSKTLYLNKGAKTGICFQSRYRIEDLGISSETSFISCLGLVRNEILGWQHSHY